MLHVRTVSSHLLNRLIQLNHAVGGPDSELRRNLRTPLIGEDRTTVRLGGGLNIGDLTLVGQNRSAIRLRGGLDVGDLALVGYNGVAVRLGGELNIGSLALVSGDGCAIRLGGQLDGRSLTLEAPLDSSLGGSLSGSSR